MVLKIKLGKRRKKDFSTERQIEKILCDTPDIKHQAREATEL